MGDESMLRYKQFVGRGQDLEAAVNRWLEANEPDVTQVIQTADPEGMVVLGFLFEESFRGQEMRLAEEHGVAQQPGPMPSAEVPDTPITVPVEPGTPQDEPPPGM